MVYASVYYYFLFTLNFHIIYMVNETIKNKPQASCGSSCHSVVTRALQAAALPLFPAVLLDQLFQALCCQIVF